MMLGYEKVKQSMESGDVKIITSVLRVQEIEEIPMDTAELKETHKIRLHMGYLIRTLSDKN